MTSRERQRQVRRGIVFIAATAITAGIVAVVSYRASREVTGRSTQRGDARAVTHAAVPTRPTLWVLAAGVSRYNETGLRLPYAAADARAVAAVLERQQRGPLYGRVRTRLLLDADVTRASILRGLDEFLGQAAPVDVGFVYLAGHGVRDTTRRRYYFLPAGASASKPHIEGLSMAEFDRQLRLVHRNLRQLVVVLDTCHAGVLARGTDERFGEDLAARLAPAEGLYILAAARSGEQSIELPSLGHGAFTHALIEGLGGAAANPDGLVTVFSLASHAARLVRQATEGRQHPYQAIVGEDLALAADPRAFARVTPPPLPSPVQARASLPRERVAVMRFENLRPDVEQNWMEKALRQEFTTALAGVAHLEVYEEPEVRFLARGETSEIEAAERAGMQKLVDGSYWVEQDRITITAHVKNLHPLQRIASARIHGPLDEFFELRGRIVLSLLDQLRIELRPGERERVLEAGSTNLAARKLLYGAESAGGKGAVGSPTPTPEAGYPKASFQYGLLGLLSLTRASYAAEDEGLEGELRATLESYRAAFVSQDVETLARFYLQFSAAQREALQRYFANADRLEVEFSHMRIAIIGNRASVSFVRRDRFIDRQTGQREQVVVRLTKLLAKGPEGWRIVPEQ